MLNINRTVFYYFNRVKSFTSNFTLFFMFYIFNLGETILNCCSIPADGQKIWVGWSVK